MKMSVVEKIQHYQKSVEKCYDDDERMLHCIQKLRNLPVTVQHLQETGVGRTINGLRKFDGAVGKAAKALVAKWKTMVANEDSSEESKEDATEDSLPDCSYDLDKSASHLIQASNVDSSRLTLEETKLNRHCNEDSKYSSKYELKSNDSSRNSRKEEDRESKHKHKHSGTHSKSDKKLNSLSNKNIGKRDDEQEVKHKHDDVRRTDKKTSEYKSSKEQHRKRKSDSIETSSDKAKKKKIVENDSDSCVINCKTNSVLESEDKNDKFTAKKDSSESSRDTKKESEKSVSKHNKQKSNHSSELKCNSEKIRNRSAPHNERKSKGKEKESHNSNKEPVKLSNELISKEQSKDKHSDKKYKDSKCSNLKEQDKSKHSKQKVKITNEVDADGIDCNSGTSFAEALGMCTKTLSTKKKSGPMQSTLAMKSAKSESSESHSTNKEKIDSRSSKLPTTLSLLTPNIKLEPLNVDLASTLPEISPHYKPLPHIDRSQLKTEEEALSDIIYAKNQRTKVYSGNKSGYTYVPSLYEICIRVLIENIDALEFTGGVPFDIIKPVLERATADQLFTLEHYNPYLIEDTDSLWQFHCNREFRNKQREEMETWREMYIRCLDEREAKLKTLTANIKQSIDKSLPARSAKLAYVDHIVKPPRNILKKQAKFGTGGPSSVPNAKQKLIAGAGANSATKISVPPPPMARAKSMSSGVIKKTKAPLMAKTLQLIKGRYKR